MFGRAAADVIGKNVSVLMPELDSRRHDNYLKGFLDTGEGKIVGIGPREVTAQHRDGSSFPMELSVGQMVLGDRRAFVGAMRDISERRRADAEVRESQEMLSGFMNSAADIFVILDADLRYVDANNSALDLIGLSKEQVRGQRLDLLIPGTPGGD